MSLAINTNCAVVSLPRRLAACHLAAPLSRRLLHPYYHPPANLHAL
jgi:hypothetical protein